MNKFVLIDGNAILHRAFHALPPLNAKDGTLANAVYGFFAMFLKIVGDLQPTYIVVCFDRPKPTFRKMLYAGYQAKRPKMSDDLAPQIGIVHDMLVKMHIAIFEVDGYEADDLIGTLSVQAIQMSPRGPATTFPPVNAHASLAVKDGANALRVVGSPSSRVTPSQNTEVIIVSGDRDLLQLVNSHVKMLAPITGITNMLLYDEAKVEEKFGVTPKQIIDYKALVGDASDNYPGVAGIGPKTARDLLVKYQTFENLYMHLADLPETTAKKLATDAEQAALAKKLATIEINAPITLKIDECSCTHFDKEKAKELFEEIGFKSLLKRLEGTVQEEKPVKKPQEKKEKQSEQLGLL